MKRWTGRGLSRSESRDPRDVCPVLHPVLLGDRGRHLPDRGHANRQTAAAVTASAVRDPRIRHPERPSRGGSLGLAAGLRFAVRGLGISSALRSTRLLFQSPSKPKVGALTGSANQKSVNAATFGAGNQWASPLLSTAHQRALFGAWDQSIFTAETSSRDDPTPQANLLTLLTFVPGHE